MPIKTPRDRKGTFEPGLVRKGQRRFEGFDDKILALYSRGLSTRDIEAHLAEIYGVKVGRDLISRVTDAVMARGRTPFPRQARLAVARWPADGALDLRQRRGAARCRSDCGCGRTKLEHAAQHGGLS